MQHTAAMKLLVLTLCAVTLSCSAAKVRDTARTFPKDFLFGTATASYQIEGGWNEDGKGENIWDRMVHTKPEVIKDLTNGDIGPDSYHNWARDVEMMRELGLDAYRFSISWARILPTGMPNQINEAGVQFYNNYINELLKYNIKPLVTMYHWDLPQKLQDLGGFTSPLFPQWFEDYANVLYKSFGDRVKNWITFNEPREICYEGYGHVTKAPLVNATGIGEYLCAKNLVVAHAKAYRSYNESFRVEQEGQVGITISVNWFTAKTDSEADQVAAELYRQGEWGLYAEPIFSAEGGFPKELSAVIADKSSAGGYPRSRLPEFSEDEKAFVRGTADFFGVNHYSGYLVSATDNLENWAVPSLYDDIHAGTSGDPEWPVAASSWLNQSPNSIFNAVSHLHNRYNGPTFYITENGWSTFGGLEDADRIRYYRASLESVLDTIEAGIDLRGYMAWSLMDNFEWMEGYSERFGLYEVNYEVPERTRTPRKSAFVYKQIIKTRTIDHEYEPSATTMTIDEGH